MEKKDLTLKNGNVLSNSIISKVSDKMSDSELFNLVAFADNEKGAKKSVLEFEKTIKESDDLSDPLVFAITAKKMADLEYQKRISPFINQRFGADFVVTNIIAAVSKTTDNEFFTPEYLDKLGIYKIPNGVILDTLQKCRSFVSSLYATALSEYKKEIKDGGGIEIIYARVKEIVAFNDSQFIVTKFANMSILRKYELLYGVIANCTKSEKVAIWKKLGVTFKVAAKGGKGSAKILGNIPIEDYKPLPNKIDINFYHKFAENAIPLSDTEAAKVISLPVTPLATEAVTEVKAATPSKGRTSGKRTSTKGKGKNTVESK